MSRVGVCASSSIMADLAAMTIIHCRLNSPGARNRRAWSPWRTSIWPNNWYFFRERCAVVACEIGGGQVCVTTTVAFPEPLLFASIAADDDAKPTF